MARVLLIHNFYRQAGGEDVVVASEESLLRSKGHDVRLYTRRNEPLRGAALAAQGLAATWNHAVYRELKRLIRDWRPDLLHVHNTFPLISPAVYYAAAAASVPVVQTLHNYRLLCVNAELHRDGGPCEVCVGRRLQLPGILHACYRGSRLGSSAVALMNGVHRALGTWSRHVDLHVALSEFARRRYVAGGLPAERVVVKPNFVHPDPGRSPGGGGFVLFAGRLAEEKGLGTLLAAWRRLGSGTRLRILGDGPLAEQVRRAARRPGIEWLGWQPRERVLEQMKLADLLVVPSTWYEGCPMVVLEAQAIGLPVLASELGGLSSLIEDGRNGFLFRPGDAEDLAARLDGLLSEPRLLETARRAARAAYEERFTAERNYALLMDIYRRALGESTARSSPG